MTILYVLSFIIGGLIGLVLYGKVPMILSLIISTMVGYLMGYIYNMIQRKKAEREYDEFLKCIRTINQED